MRKIKPHTRKWVKDAIGLAISFCPEIYPCGKCGHPVINGYCCNYCGDSCPDEDAKGKKTYLAPLSEVY